MGIAHKTGTVLLLIATLMGINGCSKDQPNLALADTTLENMDRGSNNFNRMLSICFNEPLKQFYWHEVAFKTYDRFEFKGQGRLFPLASDPKNKCQVKNIYLYIDKQSPPGSRQLVATKMIPGNIERLTVTVFSYDENQQGPGKALMSKTYTGL